METVGTPSKTKFIKSESHKLAHSFVAGGTIRKGALVKLEADGEIIEAVTTDTPDAIIGYSIHDAVAGDRITVSVRGYTIIRVLAAAVQDAGPVRQGDWNATLENFQYPASVIGTNAVHGWALQAAAAEDDEIEVLLRD